MDRSTAGEVDEEADETLGSDDADESDETDDASDAGASDDPVEDPEEADSTGVSGTDADVEVVVVGSVGDGIGEFTPVDDTNKGDETDLAA